MLFLPISFVAQLWRWLVGGLVAEAVQQVAQQLILAGKLEMLAGVGIFQRGSPVALAFATPQSQEVGSVLGSHGRILAKQTLHKRYTAENLL